MLKQPIYYEFNLDAKTSPSKLIAISHVDDKYSEVLEVAVKQNDRFVYMGGATVVARMVLHRDKDYLISDDVPCDVNDNGNIMIPFDNAVVKTMQGVVKIEVNITRDADELTLQFPLWVSVNGSILDNAEIIPESEGTIPDLLKEAADALEDAEEALGRLGSYSNLSDKPQINSVTLDGDKTPAELGLQKQLTAGEHISIDPADGTISGFEVAGWEIKAIDNCIEDGVLYSTSINNQAAYVLARNITTSITQYAFCRDGRVMWRTRQAETQWQPAGEWSAWEEIGGADDYNDLSNKPQIGFTGQSVTLSGVLSFYFGDFTGEVLPNGVDISLRENVFKSSLSPSSDILYNFNSIKSNLLYTGVFKIRKGDVTNLPQEFTDAGATIYVYHYVTTKTYSDLIRMVTYDTADGVKMWIQLVTLGGMDASDNVQVTAQTAWTDLTKDSGEVFIVGLTLTSQTGGVMDKTAAQISEAFNQGKTVIFTGVFGDQEISLKAITVAEGTVDEAITITAIAITEPDGTLYHVYVPRGETSAFSLHTYNLNALDGTTFYPSVSSEGVISWTNDGGKQNPAPVNIKGPAGNAYVLTQQDKSDIADMVLEMLPPAQVADPALILWDWEGTKLAEYDRTTALALTALPSPSALAPYEGADHTLLLFQKWNWNLTDIQDWIRAHEGEALDICASYTTLDGQNHNYWDDAITGSADAISVQKRGETTIADSTFQNYYSLRAISIPFGTTAIGGSAFWGCSALKHLGLPSSITILNGGTVRKASSLKTICIPNGVTTISFGALCECSSLEKIVIPDSVTTIAGNAFLGCYALNDLVMSENLAGRIAGICQNCYALPKFHIKSGVTAIGASTFADCRTLTDILNESHAANDSSDPAKGGTLENVNAFSGLPENYKVYVPRAKLTWYQRADNWSTIYTDHIVAIEDNLTHLKNLGFNVDAYEEAE